MIDVQRMPRQLILVAWGERANEVELERAAADLSRERDPERLCDYLRIFRKRRFPLDHRRLIDLIQSTNDRVSAFALTALSNIAHPDVRDLAFTLIESHSDYQEGEHIRGRAVELLITNYQEGDHAIVESWFAGLGEGKSVHSFGRDVLEFYEKHPNPESEARMMNMLYERGPCSTCRRHAVERLVSLDALTDSIRNECQYDANFDIRAIVKHSERL